VKATWPDAKATNLSGIVGNAYNDLTGGLTPGLCTEPFAMIRELTEFSKVSAVHLKRMTQENSDGY